MVAVLFGLLTMSSTSGHAGVTPEGVKAVQGSTIKADPVDEPARAAYPRPFSRPGTMGKDYDTWRDATGPDIGETTVDIRRLPSRVDNSTRPQFPPIYKQKGGACGQFTSVASMFTYEMNVLNGTLAKGTTRGYLRMK
jgi:hypothetical protein